MVHFPGERAKMGFCASAYSTPPRDESAAKPHVSPVEEQLKIPIRDEDEQIARNYAYTLSMRIVYLVG